MSTSHQDSLSSQAFEALRPSPTQDSLTPPSSESDLTELESEPSWDNEALPSVDLINSNPTKVLCNVPHMTNIEPLQAGEEVSLDGGYLGVGASTPRATSKTPSTSYQIPRSPANQARRHSVQRSTSIESHHVDFTHNPDYSSSQSSSPDSLDQGHDTRPKLIVRIRITNSIRRVLSSPRPEFVEPPPKKKRKYKLKRPISQGFPQSIESQAAPPVAQPAGLNCVTETILPTFEDLCDGDGILKGGLVTKVQAKTCMALPHHLRLYKCNPCIRKATGELCSFRFIREWVYQSETSDVPAGGPRFPDVNTAADQLTYRSPVFPQAFNRSPDLENLIYLRQLLSHALLPLVQNELRWLVEDQKVKFVGRQIDLVTKCDYCSATLICAAWLCTQCGSEACLRCFDVMEKLCELKTPDTGEPSSLKMHAHWLKQLQTCTKWHDHRHSPSTHIKIAHISLPELRDLHDRLQDSTSGSIHENPGFAPSPVTPLGEHNSNDDHIPAELAHFLYQPEDNLSDPYIRISVTDLESDPTIFDRLWSTGQAILVTGMMDRLKLPWTPAFFTSMYAEEVCQMLDSNDPGHPPRSTTVGLFFEAFENENLEGQPVWKLRDWPPEADFQNKFPELFQDFQAALPVPDITTHKGVLNIAAHFPTNANVPDLGPKMYIAMKNEDKRGFHGSTVLHMDVADAINMQTYAKDGDNEGCALWHLYHARDAPKLRDFLYQHHAERFRISLEDARTQFDDPIHTTRTYLDPEMRKTLREQFGVKGWEIRQRPGEAVFIPAYTAHQVCNLANCIKVAVDFVSPQSIQRCIQLSEEFRNQNHEHRKPWREDLLQINQMLLYAFESTCQGIERLKRE